MRNITVCVSDEIYKAGRIWAAQNDTTLSAAVREYLQTLIRGDEFALASSDPAIGPEDTHPPSFLQEL
jgi:hypothetical protein